MYLLEYQKACEAALAAGQIIQSYLHSQLTVQHKSKDQPVTVADREANAAIHQILLDAFPEDGWLSEETLDNAERLSQKRVWIVDPLDGTKEFLAKIPEFAVSIALAVEGHPQVGAIYNPLTQELFSCKKGGGSFLNGKSISVSNVSQLSQARLLASRSEKARGEWKKFEKKFEVVPCGSMAYKMAVVACGRADGSFSLNPKNEWDFAAGTLLVEEAGGRVAEINLKPFLFNKPSPKVSGILHANPAIFKALELFLPSL